MRFAVLASALALGAFVAHAQTVELRQSGSGHVVIPQSGIALPGDAGLRAHTLYKILVPPGRPADEPGFAVAEHSDADANAEKAIPRVTTQPINGYVAETPASLACIYQITATTTSSGCNPLTLTAVATGGSKAIAIVDAYDYPTALADLTAYSKQFGLPAPTASTFTVAYQGTTKPSADPNCAAYGGWSCWAAEEALDIEMAHAMAPAAHIYLVEANSDSNADLFAAVKKAAQLVTAAGGGEVSMSWGEGEYSTEATEDSNMTGTNVVFFASSGDSEGTYYPASSPNLVAVGGTTIARNPSTLAFEAEITWDQTGGGFSAFEARPSYQSSISSITGTHRGVPDVSAVGNPYTGVWVYMSFDNTYYGTLYAWNIFGGTSVASPLWAAMVNHAGHFSASTAAEQTLIYANAKAVADFRDVAIGTCGYYEGYLAGSGWDPCSGNGAPVGAAGK